MCRVLLPGADVDDRGLHARLDRLERRIGVTTASPAPKAEPPPTQAPPQPESPLTRAPPSTGVRHRPHAPPQPVASERRPPNLSYPRIR